MEAYTRLMTGAAIVLAGRGIFTECAGCLSAVATALSHCRAVGAASVTPGTLSLIVHTVVSAVGGLVFFLASLHPFTRGVSTTFVRSFLGPRQPRSTSPVQAAAAAAASQGAGFGAGAGGSHTGSVLRAALASSTGDRYYSPEFLGGATDA